MPRTSSIAIHQQFVRWDDEGDDGVISLSRRTPPDQSDRATASGRRVTDTPVSIASDDHPTSSAHNI